MSPESLPPQEPNPRLGEILERYGEVLVLNHEDQPQPLAQAVTECPPLVSVLLGAQSEEQLQQIIASQRAPE